MSSVDTGSGCVSTGARVARWYDTCVDEQGKGGQCPSAIHTFKLQVGRSKVNRATEVLSLSKWQPLHYRTFFTFHLSRSSSSLHSSHRSIHPLLSQASSSYHFSNVSSSISIVAIIPPRKDRYVWIKQAGLTHMEIMHLILAMFCFIKNTGMVRMIDSSHPVI